MASIALNEHDERFIEKQLKTGRYSNASDVVRAGLRMLEDVEEAREKWLDEELPARFEDVLQDPSKAVPFDAVMERLEAKHRAHLSKAR